jgi:hypothetical protein
MDTECVELADAKMMHAINLLASTSSHKSKSSGPYAVSDSLFLKLQGSPQSIAETLQIIRDILSAYGCDPRKDFRLARGEDEAREMWGHRRSALHANMKMAEGGRVWGTDVWFVFVSFIWAGERGHADFGRAVFQFRTSLSLCMRQRRTPRVRGSRLQ